MNEVDQLIPYREFYVARQAILDRDLKTIGYELLFRKNKNCKVAAIDDPNLATINVASYGFCKAQESLQHPKKIFINFTQDLILSGAPRGLPPSVTVVEILEDVAPLPEVLKAIKELKQEQYLIAVDDYEGALDIDDLLELADIIKVDVLNKSKEELKCITAGIQKYKALRLAEKVDAKETYDFLRELGFDYFQGYFFARPENMAGRTLTPSKLSKLNILGEISGHDIDLDRSVDIVTNDPSLTYGLLRLINSAAFGLTKKIESVKHAAALLGSDRLVYWLRMVVLNELTDPEKPEELFVLALTRGKTLEKLAEKEIIAKERTEKMFLLGVLSLLDIMLDTCFEVLLLHLPLSADIQNAYTYGTGRYALFIELLSSMEVNDIPRLKQIASQLGLDIPSVQQEYIEALQWADAIANEMQI